jgi:3-hydroxyisobutyrate dehydrogenase
VDVLEAPVGGGVTAAEDETLKLFMGGDREVLERHRPLLEALGDPRRIVHVGGHGSGYTAKLLVNLLWFGQAVATAEALLLGRRAGIDLGVLRGALSDSTAASEFIRRDLDALLAGDYMTSFGVDRCHEELANVVGQARALGVPFEVSSSVERIYRRARPVRSGRRRAVGRGATRGGGRGRVAIALGTARRRGLHGNGQDPCPLRHGSCPGRRVRSSSSP